MPAFKVDENLPREAAEILGAQGFDAATVLGQALGGRPDVDVAAVCRAEGRVLVTLDLDFSNIRAYPPSEHPGIVVIRLKSQDKAGVLAMLARVAPLFSTESIAGRLWIVEHDRVRVWPEYWPPRRDEDGEIV